MGNGEISASDASNHSVKAICRKIVSTERAVFCFNFIRNCQQCYYHVNIVDIQTIDFSQPESTNVLCCDVSHVSVLF